MAGITIDIGGPDGSQSADKIRVQADNLKRLMDLASKLQKGGLNGAAMSGLSNAASFFASKLGPALIAGTVVSAVSNNVQRALARMPAGYGAGATGRGEMGLMEGISSFTGTNASGVAQTLANNLRGGGLAAGWARSQGIVDLGPYTMDKFKNLEKALDMLRRVQDRDYRMFLTRELVGPEMAPMVEMSDWAYSAKKWMDKQTDLTPEQQEGIANASGIWDSITNMTKGGIQQWIGDIFSGKVFENITDPSKIGLDIGRMVGRFKYGDVGDDAIRDNTDALRENTRAAKNESINVGSRGKRSIPRSWRGVIAEEAMKEQARLLGGI